VIASATERQYARPGVRLITRYVEPIFKKPDNRDGERDGLAFAPKRNGEHDWKRQLSQSSALGFQASAEKADNRMSRFVKQEIGIVKKEDEAGFGLENQERKGGDSNQKADQLFRRHAVPTLSFKSSIGREQSNSGAA
jgi:hypothetical protein